MITDIWQVILNVTKEKLGYPLCEAEGGGADDLIRSLGKEYGNERLQAMWLYYIGSSTERGYGLSVEAFSEPRRLSKYAGMVTKVKKFAGKVIQLTGYVCERDTLINFTFPWCMGEGAMRSEGELPECHPNPCPLCKSRMWQYEGVEYMSRRNKVIEHFREEAVATAVPGVLGADGGGQRGDGDMRKLSQVAEGIAAEKATGRVQQEVLPEEIGDVADDGAEHWF